MPVETFGLTHLALAVANPERSFRFYEKLLGARLLATLEGREESDLAAEDWIEFGVPGCHDVITLRRAVEEVTGNTGQLAHFGFRLVAPEDPDSLAGIVEAAGGTVVEKGRFESSGDPFVFARDPDGYPIELWFEEDPAWRTTADLPSSPEGFVRSYERALATQDWAAVDPLIDDGACVTFSTGAVHIGKPAVQRAFEQNFSAIEDEVYRISNVRWVEQADDVAVYLFDFSWTGRIDGEPASGSGRGTCVIRRRDGEGWRLLVEHLGPGT